MKKIITYTSIIITVVILSFAFSSNTATAGKAGCDAYLYISNNSLFEIKLTIDGFPSGNLMVGKNKTYTVNLANDEGKRIKVRVDYQDPDYIDPKSINYVTKTKLECGMSDTVYVSFSK
jgi:hypothetical protein